MARQGRVKFETQVESDLLAELRTLAPDEGRQIQALVDEPLANLIGKRTLGRPCAHVLAAYGTSHRRFALLYKKLAE